MHRVLVAVLGIVIVACRIFFLNLFIYLFFYGCVGSSSPREGLLQSRQVGATPHRGARAPLHRGLSRCGAQAPDTQAQQLWLTGPAAPRHVGSPQTRARTRVPRTGRQTLNHCATREVPACRILTGAVHAASSSLTRDRTPGPLQWALRVLPTGPPG